MSESRVVLFQASDHSAKFERIAQTARFHFVNKEYFIIFVEDERAVHFVDELLWKFPKTSFLPHAPCEGPSKERIAITRAKENMNGAFFAFNLCPTPLLLPGFKIIYDFEDLTTPNKKKFSSLRFQAYKEWGILIESRYTICKK